MILHHPIIITARLLPGVEIAGSYVSIERDGETRDNRDRFRYYIDYRDSEFSGNDLSSGVGGGALQSGLASLFSFLSGFAESRRYGNPDSDGWDLFPDELADWAMDNGDMFSLLSCELEEQENLIEE
jgi:hypothetical protein